MFHLDNETGVPVMPDLPPTQSNEAKWFTEGGNGVSPSWPGSTWFNIIQAEMLNVLAAAGITPDKENLSQLSEAITNLINSDSNTFLKVANNLSEIEDAGPAAVAAAWNHLGIGALLTGALQKANNLSEIKTAGPAAVAQTLLNLGLRNVAHSQMTTYLTAGTFTFTVPDGVYRIKCRVIGGGGGAGGSASAKSGGGGGAGGYAEGWIDVTPGQTITITVGIGGSGGTAGNFGVSGGLSSVGGFMSASGGAYGDAGGGGTGAGGFGGTGTGGSVNSVGSDGSDGTTTGAVGAGVGGGSALGGSTRSGGSGRNSLSIGGGGSASYTTTAQSGGNGHAGAVIMEY
ncbi:hypothetical protein ACYAGF_000734 [Yersinia enterocolitica]